MADVPGDDVDGGLIINGDGGRIFNSRPGTFVGLSEGGGGVLLPTFKMRGRDDGRTPGVDYIIWLHTGSSPDFAGTGFAGGSPTPIGSYIASSAVNLGELG